MPKIDVGRLTLYYDDTGAGEALVLIPGLSVDHTAFQATQVPEFAAAGYRCISIDNRDVGQSDTSPTDSYTIRDMADDTAALIRALGLERPHVLGWSMGGMIAQELAIRAPDVARSLTLYSTQAGMNPWIKAWLQGMIILRSKCNLREFLLGACAWIFGPRFFAQPGALEGFIEMACAHPFPQSAEAFARQCGAIQTHDAGDRLGAIGVPTHVIVGEDDILTPPESSRWIAERIPGARLTVVPGVGHAAGWEDTARFNNAVTGFLSALTGTAGR